MSRQRCRSLRALEKIEYVAHLFACGSAPSGYPEVFSRATIIPGLKKMFGGDLKARQNGQRVPGVLYISQMKSHPKTHTTTSSGSPLRSTTQTNTPLLARLVGL